MASSSVDIANVTPDEEDIRGDGKKKKFKPLSAVRKLFSGRSKRKKESVVAVKAQSTTALHSGVDVDEDDDDGGFKSHQTKAAPSLAGTRSISEDSIFTPTTTISTFPTSAVSVECVPQAQLQSELLTKLTYRRSQYSDDDHDDGLPRSPVQPITTADVINGEYLKPVTSGKKHLNQGSAQSLISVDSSENEEDSLFISKWKESVPAKKSSPLRSTRMSEGSTSDEPLDFSNIQKTELLKSTAAKDRISIKPQSRRASRLSRKKKETSQSLPSLNEESPMRIRVENDGSTAKSVSVLKEADRNIPVSPAVDIKASSTPKPSPAILSSSAPSAGIMMSAAPSSENNTERSAQQQDASRVGGDKVIKNGDKTETPKNITKSNSIKARAEGFQNSVSPSSNQPTETIKPEGTSLKVTDPTSKITSSPREDYKIKRQNRSKTIPAGNVEEDNATKVQRASSQRVQTSSAFDKSPVKEQQQKTIPATNETPPASQTPSSTGPKKPENNSSKFVKQESSSTTEPDWITRMRKKKEEQAAGDDKEKDSSESNKNVSKSSETTSSNSSVSNTKSSFSSVKSVFGANNSQDQKRGSIDTGKPDSGKDSRNVSELPKKDDVPKEVTTTKRTSIDIGSIRRESLEINVSELNSVKAMTSSFSSASKRESMAARWNSPKNDDTKTSVPSTSTTTTTNTSSATPASTSERAKLFSGGSATSATSTTPSPAGPNASKPPSSGISQSRFGSAKTSPTKSVEPKSVFVGHRGSLKTTSQSPGSAAASSSASTPKSDSVSSTPKLDSQSSSASETKSVTSNANNVGSNSSSVSSSRPLSHINFSSSQSTPKPTSPKTSPTQQSSSQFVKPVSIGVKSSPFSAAKPSSASTPASASNISNSSVSSSKPSTNTVSTSSTSSTTSSSSSSSSSSTSSSQTKASPIRSHMSFTTSPAHRPQISTNPSSNSSSSSSPSNALSKSSSMKATSTDTAKQGNDSSTAKVPAWRANLAKKEVKIEIIEKPNSSTPSSTPLSSSTQNKNENGKKMRDSSRVAEMAKTTETRSPAANAAEKASHRSSKVLDLVKNFQNLQVSS